MRGRRTRHEYRNPAHREGGQYLMEPETDDTKDPGNPFRFSDAAEKAQREKWHRLINNREPRRTIPVRLLGSSGNKPPLLLYGWPFKENYLVDYAKRHNLTYELTPESLVRAALGGSDGLRFADLTDEHYRTEPLMDFIRGIARRVVLSKLIRATGLLLDTGRPLSLEWPSMLVMYTNYDVEEQYAPLEQMDNYDQVLEILDKAMNDDPAAPRLEPMWWWSWNNDVGVLSSVD
ncbi:hypothetical protein C8Q80DRAFT_1219822 [Daedaleopsis nitida]|nr:hypothetical protein C8Q80DRAFT_1219822 [Daedaleopsis nitida]